ncbi:MAG TPA: tyrosine recombinase [Acidimicrobiales bacterium]|nr:tyrosine recombinase [Acidimicrobiales bacterium]
MTATPLTRGSEEYLSWLEVERGRSRLTITSYRRDLGQYESTLATAGLEPAAAAPEQVEGYLAHLRTSGRSPASVARATSVVRGLHRFLLDEGLAAADPTTDLTVGRVPLRLPKALSEEEVSALLGAVVGDGAAERRDRALMEVLYGTGARISEVVGLDQADLSAGDGLVRLYGKGSKERLVPLGRYAAAALDGWLSPLGRGSVEPRQWRRRGDAEAVFLNLRGSRLSRQGAYAVVKRYAVAVHLGDRVSPHVLRHSCATHMLARGADIRVVQELLGHVSIATTQLYTKVSPEHLRAAYEAAHPRSSRDPGRAVPATYEGP